MIVDKLFRFKSGAASQRRSAVLLWILGAMLLAALFIRVETWLFPDQPKPLLEPAAGLVQGPTVEAVEAEVDQNIPEPTNLIDASIAVVGYYAQEAENIPAGSSVIVLAKNDWRFAEILIRPGMSYDAVHASYTGNPEEPVQIGSITGAIVNISDITTKCVAGIGGVPGMCKISLVLLFPFQDGVATVAADGPHATQGELIAIARSMIEAPEETR